MARDFNSGTDAVNTPGFTAMHNTDILSIACWLRREGTGGAATGRILDHNTQWLLMYQANAGGSLRFSTRRWTSDGTWRWTDSAGANTWYHLVVTYSMATADLDPTVYIDGASVGLTEDASGNGTKQTNTDFEWAWGNNESGIRNWDGQMAHCALWNRLLTAGEVKTVMNYGPMRVPSGLHVYMPLYGNNDPEPNYNTEGNALDGTVVSTTASGFHPPTASLWGFDSHEEPTGAAAAARRIMIIS